MKDLKILLRCFDRAVDTMQRTQLYLTFLSSQLEDEGKVFKEARTAIAKLRGAHAPPSPSSAASS